MEHALILVFFCLVVGLLLARLLVPSLLPGTGFAIWLETNVSFGDGDGDGGGGDGGGGD